MCVCVCVCVCVGLISGQKCHAHVTACNFVLYKFYGEERN